MGLEIVAVEVCETEEIILALLDFLVDPLLPSKCLSNSPLHEDLVAKQMNAVVLLYNYYHRKQNPLSEFLEYDSFCNLAMALKPNLLPYLPLIQRPDYGELEFNDMDKHMSLVDKEVRNACLVSRSLDASIDKPDIEGWPVSRVAVFLVDLKKENCFLFHSSITQGVWSVIEDDVTLPDEEIANKKKRVIRKTLRETDEAILQQVAYSSVKETCAFKQRDLRILEAHMAYSTSKEKTVARLYIMQCRNSKPECLVPISDALGSLQGPLVRKESGNWLHTPMVEYFHLLPFAEKLSDWHSRSKAIQTNGTPVETEEWPNPSDDDEEIIDIDNCNGSHINDKLVTNTSGLLGVSKDAVNSNNHRSVKEVVPNLPPRCEAARAVSNGSISQSKVNNPHLPPQCEAAQAVNNGSISVSKVNNPLASPLVESAIGIQNGTTDSVKKELFPSSSEPTKVYKKRNRSQKNISSDFQGNAAEENSRQEKECRVSGSLYAHDRCRYHADEEKQIVVAAENDGTISYFDQEKKQDCAIVPLESNSEFLRKVQLTIAPKENKISRTALNVLYRKRELLSQKIREMVDEVALCKNEVAVCEKNIDIIVKGNEGYLDVAINFLMEGCNDLSFRSAASESKTRLQYEDPDLPLPSLKRKRLSEANLSPVNSCWELDRICNENAWTLPTYKVSTLEGGFKASVIVKGVDFESSSETPLSPTPQEARNLAALLMFAKLQNLRWNHDT